MFILCNHKRKLYLQPTNDLWQYFGHVVLIGSITWPYAWWSSPLANETSQIRYNLRFCLCDITIKNVKRYHYFLAHLTRPDIPRNYSAADVQLALTSHPSRSEKTKIDDQPAIISACSKLAVVAVSRNVAIRVSLTVTVTQFGVAVTALT